MSGAAAVTASELDAANRRIEIFSAEQTAFMASEKRSAMTSPMFDLPRRSAFGWQFLYEHAVPVLREVAEHASPEQLGERMRGLGRRPYQSQVSLLMSGVLGARQQHIIELGLEFGDPVPGERAEDIVFLTEYWERLQRAYRGDGELFPRAGAGATRILEPETLERVRDLLVPVGEGDLAALHRTSGLLQSYSLLLHGELRDGTFMHGPYPHGEGTSIIVKEFNDLDNDFLSWAGTPTRLPYGNVAVAYAVRGVTISCDMFGSALTDPLGFDAEIEAVAVLTSADGTTLERLDSEAAAAVGAAASKAQDELFAAVLGWEPARRMTYGAELFGNYLVPFAKLAGRPELAADIRHRCEQTIERVGKQLAERPPWEVWAHMANPGRQMFWPLSLSGWR